MQRPVCKSSWDSIGIFGADEHVPHRRLCDNQFGAGRVGFEFVAEVANVGAETMSSRYSAPTQRPKVVRGEPGALCCQFAKGGTQWASNELRSPTVSGARQTIRNCPDDLDSAGTTISRRRV